LAWASGVPLTWVLRPPAPTATTGTTRMRARLMAITVLRGFRAASSSAPGRGTAAIMADVATTAGEGITAARDIMAEAMGGEDITAGAVSRAGDLPIAVAGQ